MGKISPHDLNQVLIFMADITRACPNHVRDTSPCLNHVIEIGLDPIVFPIDHRQVFDSPKSLPFPVYKYLEFGVVKISARLLFQPKFLIVSGNQNHVHLPVYRDGLPKQSAERAIKL